MTENVDSRFAAGHRLVTDAVRLLEDSTFEEADRVRAAATRIEDPNWTILVAGLRSVGKSSLVGALWGDADMLPTAVRDCTQTNTLIRVPEVDRTDDQDRQIRISYLTRDAATEFATHGLAYERLAELVHQALGPMGPRMDKLNAEERIRASVDAVRELFEQKPNLLILHEHLTDAIDELDEFAAFLDSSEFRPGETVDARWDDRREHLMGKRQADFRKVDVGRMLAFRHVEIVRKSDRWSGRPPRLIDTPWIPAFHNARRADLILRQARSADILLLVGLPEPFELEEWTTKVLRERPDLASRTVLVFNQVDTVDRTMLFGRNGFGGAYRDCTESLVRLGFDEQNLVVCCARLPFLECTPPDDFVKDRIKRLQTVLDRIRDLAEPRKEGAFRDRLLAACDPVDAGLITLRTRLEHLGAHAVRNQRVIDALDAIGEIEDDQILEDRRASWSTLSVQVPALKKELADSGGHVG